MIDLPTKYLLRPDEVANFLNVSRSTIYFWCKNGFLKFCKLNHTIRIFRKSVLEYYRKNTRI